MSKVAQPINNHSLINFLGSIESVVGDWAEFKTGSVWLAGVGAGNGQQVTLEVLKAIITADVIVHDELIPHAILKFARSDAIVTNCGKRVGSCILRQKEICLKLIDLAKSNKKVLRLKGGDPTIFSRIGEEISSLVEAKISYRILAGLSAAQCAASLLGIPLTHRKISTSISFCTGSFAVDTLNSTTTNRQTYSCNSHSTLIFYMANNNIQNIASDLIEKGRKKDDSIAIISNIGSRNEAVFFTTLENINQLATEYLPATFIIGEVVKLSPFYPTGYNNNII